MTFGERVLQARKSRGWTRERLAEEVDLDPRTVAYIERGEKNAGPTVRRKIEDVLENI